jgi:hypothetical protein
VTGALAVLKPNNADAVKMIIDGLYVAQRKESEEDRYYRLETIRLLRRLGKRAGASVPRLKEIDAAMGESYVRTEVRSALAEILKEDGHRGSANEDDQRGGGTDRR